MKKARLASVLVAVGIVAAVAVINLGQRDTRASNTHMPLKHGYAKLALSFEPNRGQADPGTAFLARGAGYSIALKATGAVFALGKRDRLRMDLTGANMRAALVPEQPLPGTVNYLLGNERSRWLTGLPTYARLRARDVYPGIDLTYYGNQGRFEYDLLVHPGARPETISLSFAGARQMHLDGNGTLAFQLAGGVVRQLAPRVYQRVGALRRPVEARFVLRGKRVAFALGLYDRRRTLVIDPVLLYSTYLGGGDFDAGYGIAVDAGGSAYLTGSTASTNFPTASPLQAAKAGGGDAFVAKLNSAGTALVYATYLGGGSDDVGYGVAVDGSGSAYVSGFTLSENFPIAPATPLQATNAGAGDAFVAKLNAAGTALVYSTYVGGGGEEGSRAIAVDAGGSAYLSGYTYSANFPTANPLQAGNAGGPDAFVAKLNVAGTALVYSTYLGGSGYEEGAGIALDGSGRAYLTGFTGSGDFPTASPLQTSFGGGSYDAFATRLNVAGTALDYSTYLGGSNSDEGHDIEVDSSGSAYLIGTTSSTDFPTANPLQATKAGDGDAFVAKLNAAGTALNYSTYLGGSGLDVGLGIAVDANGSAHLTGNTSSTNFPAANALQATNAGGADAFVAKLNVAGTALVYSTYLGGSNNDLPEGIAIDAAGSAYVTGQTGSTNFPTAPTSPLQAANGGGADAFVAKIREQATAVSLRSFVASRSGRLVVLRWRTGYDLSLVGFHVYRQKNGRLVRLNRAWIPSVFGGTASGHAYSWPDRSAPQRGSLRYRLQGVDLSGKRSWLGSATAS